ncbi:MAG: hypothetical protein RH862_19040 [Leptospiraceae bacterium]
MTEIIIFFLGTVGTILTFAAFFIPIYLLFKVSSLSRRVRELENQISSPAGQSMVREPEPPTFTAEQSYSRREPSGVTVIEQSKQDTPAAESASAARYMESQGRNATAIPTSPQEREVESPAVPPPPTAFELGWKKLEAALAENWTGILGTIILVVGVAFLGVYAALKMGPFLRFLMVLGIAAGLFAASVYLARKEHWRPLAVWIRSGSGAILLLACLGSALFPAMRWVHDENLALLLILFGVGANLALAWWSSVQTVASIHTAISILALLILPKSPLLYSIIAGISIFSTYLSYRARWEFHLLQAVSVFFLANLVYGMHYGAPNNEIHGGIRWIGLFSTGAVSVLALLLHYRSRYGNKSFERWPFISHIVTWATAALGFALYSSGSRINTIVLFSVALAVYLHARRARNSKIRWLYHTDSIMALLISLLGALTLQRWEWDLLASGLVCTALMLAFSVAASMERETLLKGVGVILLHIAWVFLSVIFFAELTSHRLWYQSGILLASLILSLAYIWFDRHRINEEERLDASLGLSAGSPLSFSGVFSGIFVLLLAITLRNVENAEYYISGLSLALLFSLHGFKLNQLSSAVLPVLFGLHFLVFYRAYDQSPGLQVFTDAPLLILFLAGILLAPMNIPGKQPWVQSRLFAVLLIIHVIALTYILSSPHSSLLPGVLWLSLSIAFLEIDRWSVSGKSKLLSGIQLARPVWFLGALSMVLLFLISHLFVHLQSETLLGPIRARLLIQIYAISVFLYWAMTGPLVQKSDTGILSRFATVFWELVILFLSMAVALEMGPVWLPVIWILLAGLLRYSIVWSIIPGRFEIYSIFFFWASVIHTAVVSSTYATPSNFLADQAWFGGLIAVAGQLIYLLLQYSPYLGHRERNTPIDWLSQRFQRFQTVADRKELSIFYPLFLSVALFLFWSFDSSLLTLFWMIEVFVVFIIGLRLNQDHFRYVAQIAMVICLIRLIFFDLSQSSVAMQAFVFLGVGGIMILMNVIYRRFRSNQSPSDKT